MHTPQVKPLRFDQDVGAGRRPAQSRGCPERRSVLRGIGHAGLAALLAPGLSLLRSDRAKADPEPLTQPSEIRSRNGELNATLTASPSEMRLGDVEFPGFLYNDAYMPPLLVVDGAETLFPILKDLPERFFLIKHAEPGGGREVISVNGQMNPSVEIRPGEMQFWRIAHIGATLFAPFRFSGVSVYVIATDGHPLSRPRKMSEVVLGPGQRIDAIVIGPPPGEYAIATLPFKNMAWREIFPGQQVATIVSAGAPALVAAEPEVLRQRVAARRWIDEVRASTIARQRRIVYSRTEDRSVFMIDGRVISDDRVDQTVKLGDTEEWTIVNTDQQYHSFHMHQTPFLLTEVNGTAQDEDSLRDTMPIPPANEDRPGSIKVSIPFTDPEIVGRFVYHCHAVDHEDKGMMGTVMVVA
jgi:suppressor of ftsI